MKARATLVGLLMVSTACYSQESLQDLYARVPAPPATSAAAEAWLESTAVAELKAQIATQRSGIEKLMAAAGAAQQLTGMPEDFERAQRDPKYAEELKAKIAKMTPAEQMAFAQRMSAATSTNALRDVQAMANDSPAVTAAAEHYVALQTRAMSMGPLLSASNQINAIRDRVNKRKSEIFAVSTEKMQCSDGEGGCPSKEAELADARVAREAQAAVVAEIDHALPEIAESIAILREARTADIAAGQHDMAATNYGAAAQSATHRQQLASYHGLLLTQVEQLLQTTTDVAEWAARP